MDNRELRCGNNVMFGIHIMTVAKTSIYPDDHTYDTAPIKLSADVLIKMGFEKIKLPEIDKNCFSKTFGSMKLIIAGIGFWDVYTIYDPIAGTERINYITNNRGLNAVHELQNLCYALTREELVLPYEFKSTKSI